MFRELKDFVFEQLKKALLSRFFYISVLFVVLFSILIARLYDLQIIKQNMYASEYEQKSFATISLPRSRGNIYDKNGVLLAYNILTYAVTLNDIGAYPKHAQKNEMIYSLIQLLDTLEEDIDLVIPITYSESDGFSFNSETTKKRFLRDLYGLKSTNDLDDANGKYPSSITPEETITKLKKLFRFDTWKDEQGELIEPNAFDTLRIVNIRWALKEKEYQKYKSITIVSNIKETSLATLTETLSAFKGLDITESYIRTYPEGSYFASIIGYTGKPSVEELAKLQLEDSTYDQDDIVGKSGVEALLELELNGTRGSQSMYKDSTGKVLKIIEREEPQVGNDVSLTILHDLQIATYHLIEQTLAGILTDKIVFSSAEIEDSSDILIPINKVYFQLFNNNIISIQMLNREDADENEQSIYRTYQNYLSTIIEKTNKICFNLEIPYEDLTEQMKRISDYIYAELLSETGFGIVDTKSIDKENELFKKWSQKSISIKEFLYGLIENRWIITTALEIEDEYIESNELYDFCVTILTQKLANDNKFAKILFEFIINDGLIKPHEICQVLFTQNILTYEDNEYNKQYHSIKNASDEDCFDFMLDLVKKIKITPAQLALDPCSASTVITEVNSGKVLALVSYPSYDNNKFSGSVDPLYYNQLVEDQSKPLFNYATQARSAPGSTYKMLTCIAGLEEGVVSYTDKIECLGVFDKVSDKPKCWIHAYESSQHGLLTMMGGLANSCNCYFYEVGYRLSLDNDGNYNEKLGIDHLTHYAKLLGFDSLTGVEMNEYVPQISTQYPIVTAIGQGKNNYTAVQLARYISTIANGGTLYPLSLLNQITQQDGTVVKSYNQVGQKVQGISESTWSKVQESTKSVITEGTVRDIFKDSTVLIAGKTGSAEEDFSRPNHALFVSYAPANDPEISITTTIRNGYTSANTALLAKEIYEYYYGDTTLEDILSNHALSGSDTVVND